MLNKIIDYEEKRSYHHMNKAMLPKRHLVSAMSYFFKDRAKYIYQITKSKNKDIFQIDLMTRLTNVWKSLTNAERKPYFDMQKIDKDRFDRQTQELIRYGYYTNDDGTKSNSVELVIKD